MSRMWNTFELRHSKCYEYILRYPTYRLCSLWSILRFDQYQTDCDRERIQRHLRHQQSDAQK